MFYVKSIVRSRIFITAICAVASNAQAGIFSSSGGGISLSPNAVKLNGVMDCTFKSLGVIVDPDIPLMILTDKSMVDSAVDPSYLDPNSYPYKTYPGTPVDCTETVDGVDYKGTGVFQQLAMSGTLAESDGKKVKVSSGLLVENATSTEGTKTYTTQTYRYYVDDSNKTEERLRFIIQFDPDSEFCDGITDCFQEVGLPDSATYPDETDIDAGSKVFPETTNFAQNVIAKISLKFLHNDDGTFTLTDFTNLQQRLLHTGTEDSSTEPVAAVYTDNSTSGKPLKVKLNASLDTNLELIGEYDVNPNANVTTNPNGTTPVYLMGSEEIDISKVLPETFKINGTNVSCVNYTTVYANNDTIPDWKCGADTEQFMLATGLLSFDGTNYTENCDPATDSSWTAEFSVSLQYDSVKTATGVDTFPINCH